MKRTSRRPLRTCVGCRTVREQQALVRIVADVERGAVVNPERPQGRGAYLCPSLACFAQAWKRKAFWRAFRRDVSGWGLAATQAAFAAELRRRGIRIPKEPAAQGAKGGTEMGPQGRGVVREGKGTLSPDGETGGMTRPV